MAVSEAMKQVIWIWHSLYAIGKGFIYNGPRPNIIFEDNQGAIRLLRTLLSTLKQNWEYADIGE